MEEFLGSLKKPEHKESGLSVFRYSRRGIELVWTTSRKLTLAMAGLTVAAGLMPAAIAYVGKLLVDSVVSAQTGGASASDVLLWVGVEAGLVALVAAIQRGLSVSQSLLRAQLGHRVNTMVLEKALTLELAQFEDSEFYDKLSRARREASRRPLSLVNRTFGLIQQAIALTSYAGLLLSFSGWAVVVLIVAGLPAFFAETKFSGEAFRLFTWRSTETRQQNYLEVLLAREDYVKEVKLYGLGQTLLARYRKIFVKLYGEDRSLTLRRGAWGFGLGLLGTGALYGAYAWTAVEAAGGTITLGDMTMYLLVFKQGQAAFSAALTSIGGMYEDNLYLSNLYDYLEQPSPVPTGVAEVGPRPHDGVRFEDVHFTYPGADEPAISGVSFHLQPGQKLALVGDNGSGKTTLIKLLTRLYEPSSGRICLDGLDLREWDLDALHRRIGVIFQDFVRYQFQVGENIGVGEVESMTDAERWADAADRGMAAPFIEAMPDGYHTQLGRWFKDGRELSGGQWQKVALSRAFMRRTADLLVLDEPTSAMDAEAESQIFDHVREAAKDQMTILISHRFSTVRMADSILVLQAGRVTEAGTHEELMNNGGRYAQLFNLQAAGYQ